MLVGISVRRQSGMVLIFSMIILVVFTVIGLSTMKMTSMSEKQSYNIHDRETALSATENTLGVVESWIGCSPLCPGTQIKYVGNRNDDVSDKSIFEKGENGLYELVKAPAPRDYAALYALFSANQGFKTDMDLQNLGVSSEPLYIVEWSKTEDHDYAGGSMPEKGSPVEQDVIYRVVAQGKGGKDSSVIMIESNVKRMIDTTAPK